ncbi:MAG: hypothetical protein ACI92W_001518 [Paraglaciecola sp.]|jgi:hypothetical protein
MRYLPLLLAGLIALLGSSQTMEAQSRFDKMAVSPLFSDTSILNVTLAMDISTVTSDIEVRDEHKGTLTFVDDKGKEVEIDLKIKIRGKTRANPKVCRFPPLRLDLKKKGNDDNIFAGQNKLKLVDHCEEGKNYEQYILQEYLIYKMYNLITDLSFKVRLLRITYEDTAGETAPFTKYGFLIEDEDAMADRNGMITGGDVFSQDRCEQSSLDVLTVFQYLIGNTDWGVAAGHNMKIIGKDSVFKQPIAVPYDFDYSGLINAHYAKPPANLPITNVRTRIFRGYCRLSGTYEKAFEVFLENRDAIYNLYNSFSRLDEKKKKQIIRYLDSFYETIENPKMAEQEILTACSIEHRHVY